MAIILDTLLYAQRLQKAGVSQELAEAHAEITRDMVLAEVASRDDLQKELTQLRSEINALEQKARWLGGIFVAGTGLLVAIITLVLNIFGK